MKILGIETSCDETAVAIVSDDKTILSNQIYSQIAEHQKFGGVVPELASRAHITHIDGLIKAACDEAKTPLDEIDAIAVTAGPGLIGGVLVGVMTAKALASSLGKPCIAVNHLEGHALTARLTDDVPFPFLLLLVSGGHCQILIVKNVGEYECLGSTIDDALGEAFDKTAKMLGLGYPGGPIVEQRAKYGNPDRFKLPKPLLNREGFDFSFSGLKTAVSRLIESRRTAEGIDPKLPTEDINDICASFQKTCGDILDKRMGDAMALFKEKYPDGTHRGGTHVVIAGGVAANQYLRGRLQTVCAENGLVLSTPPVALCTDNGVMIAWAGIERYKLGLTDSLDFIPRARWNLYEGT